jgi:hypothetical protein
LYRAFSFEVQERFDWLKERSAKQKGTGGFLKALRIFVYLPYIQVGMPHVNAVRRCY